MKKWIVMTGVLLLTTIGAGTFAFLKFKEASTLSAELESLRQEFDDQKEQLEALTKSEGDGPSPLAVMQQKAKEFDAVRDALSNGQVLTDYEMIVKAQKTPSADRILGLGALRLLVKGKEDPGVVSAFEEALKLMDIESRMQATCAAQAGMRATGAQIKMLSECERLASEPRAAADSAQGKTAESSGKPAGSKAPDAPPQKK